MRSNKAIAQKTIRFLKTHWILFTALLLITSMQSLMMLLIELGNQIMTTGFEQSQWVHPDDRVLVQAIPASVFWHYIQQHHAKLSLRFGHWLGQMLVFQLPLVMLYIGLGRWRQWQHDFALMLWAWPIATPFVGFAIYRRQAPTRQQFLRYLGIGIGFIGLGSFAFAPHVMLQFIGQFLTFLFVAIWFMISGVMFALLYTFTVLLGDLGMSGEIEREGLSYSIAVIGYFELFWFSLFLKQRLQRRSA
jgi:hypothetical protein